MMRFCFIIEEEYRKKRMPLAVVGQLRAWGHEVDLLQPQVDATCLFDLAGRGCDAFVLKTASHGPGLTLLEAAAVAGIPTINNPRSIRLVRDKAVAMAIAHAYGLPVPLTYFVADSRLLAQIPAEAYPLVVKPNYGSSCGGIYRLEGPAELFRLEIPHHEGRFYLAQRYVRNAGFDVKLYVTGMDVDAIVRKSPLHPDVDVAEGPIAVTPELRMLALDVGRLFGLEIYGLDVVDSGRGWSILDVNDFPSYGLVPQATARVAESILNAVKRGGRYVRPVQQHARRHLRHQR